MPETVYPLPIGIAAAITTGRPELARMAIDAEIHRLRSAATPTEVLDAVNVLRTTLGDYAVAMVSDIQTERDRLLVMRRQMRNAVSNMAGALRTVERIEAALELMAAGAPTEQIEEALTNRARRDDD